MVKSNNIIVVGDFISFRVTVVKDRNKRQSKGIAFVLYLNSDDARKAVSALHQTFVSCY